MDTLVAEIYALVGNRDPRSLVGPEAEAFQALRARVDALTIAEKELVEADLRRQIAAKR